MPYELIPMDRNAILGYLALAWLILLYVVHSAYIRNHINLLAAVCMIYTTNNLLLLEWNNFLFITIQNAAPWRS